jgi:hypothetical protein
VFTLDPDYRSVKALAFTADGKSLIAGTARGRAFLRFADGDGAKLHSPEKVREALKVK